MKRLCLIAAAICIQANALSAQVVVFDHSGVIQDGELYSYVVVHNTPPEQTVLNMQGGQLTGLGMDVRDTAIVNISGGQANVVSAANSSRVNLSGGELGGLNIAETATARIVNGAIGGLSTFGHAAVDVLGGNVQSSVSIDEWSSVNINGGSVGSQSAGLDLLSVADQGRLYLRSGQIQSDVEAWASATLDLSGGSLNGYLRASDSSNVNIYGSVSSVEPGSVLGRFLMTGAWADGMPFQIELYDSQTLSHINIVPEPSALLIVLAGGLLQKTRRRVLRSAAVQQLVA